LIQVYGATWKELIHEEFGDGIVSAIGFEMGLEHQPDPRSGEARDERKISALQEILIACSDTD